VLADLRADVVARAHLVGRDRQVGASVEEHLASDVVREGAWPHGPREVSQEEGRIRPDHLQVERIGGPAQPRRATIRAVGHSLRYGTRATTRRTDVPAAAVGGDAHREHLGALERTRRRGQRVPNHRSIAGSNTARPAAGVCVSSPNTTRSPKS
jgi:hypothetical protein